MAQEIIEAPLAGKVITVLVKVGDRVKEGDTLCILESLKMENSILTPVSGVVKEIRVAAGQAVKANDVMAIIEY
jgi:biotin carboxyl carrier protein